MSQPVWTLSVDLQTKTATFTSGLADAAKGARSSFNDIKSGAQDMGRETSYSMMEARHSVMMLGEEFGVRLPRALSTFIASLGPIGPALEAAFPFLAIATAATLLLEHIGKMHESAAKTAEAWRKVADVGAEAFEVMHDRLIQAEIKADELAGDHLGALEKKLELIDHQTMKEVIGELDKMAAAADTAFKGLEHGWFMRMLMGHADVGPAKQQLEEFITEIDKLKQGGGKPADVQALIGGNISTVKTEMDGIWNRLEEAKNNLANMGDDKEFAGMRAESEKTAKLAQEEWTFKQKELDILTQMQRVSGEGVKVANLDKQNDRTEESKREQAEQERISEIQMRGLAEYIKRNAEAQRKVKELRSHEAEDEEHLAELMRHADEAYFRWNADAKKERAKLAEEAGRETAAHELAMATLRAAAKREGDEMLLAQGKITARELLQADKEAEQQEYQAKRQALSQELNALNQSSNDYMNRKMALYNKLEELETQHQNKMQQLEDQSTKRQLATLSSFVNRMEGQFNQGFAQVITGRQTFGRMMEQLAAQEVEAGLRFALMSVESLATAQGRKRFGDARTAAADAYASAGNPIAGAVEAAVAFSSVMALERGGIVPGVEMGDVVPARLTPGETVIPKQMTERLNRAAGDSDNNQPRINFHHSPTYHVHAIDGASVRGMLDKHKEEFSRHFHSEVRKLNR
jgi:hypothetical protein